MQTALMLGAGLTPPVRRLRLHDSASDDETEWTTLDIDPGGHPNIRMDLGDIEMPVSEQITKELLSEWKSSTGLYDEIHAYDIIEHYGQQGNYEGFFRGFSVLHRALKAGGALIGTTPAHDSLWLWSDPGHRRVITIQTLAFLVKDHYKQLGRTRCTDYRRYVAPYWWTIETYEQQSDVTEFALRAVDDKSSDIR